jgi:2'-5' RNA ligase
MRTFLSYDIDDRSVLSKVGEFQTSLTETGADLKFVRPEILHFTVRFIGEIDEQRKNEIVSVLDKKVPGLDVEVKFRGIGTFPNEKRIAVIWIASDRESSTKLDEQARFVNNLLDEKIPAIPKEEKDRFNPHVTIARVRTGRNKDRLLGFLQENRDHDFGSAKIGSLRLKQSVLLPQGPNYSDLHVFS